MQGRFSKNSRLSSKDPYSSTLYNILSTFVELPYRLGELNMALGALILTPLPLLVLACLAYVVKLVLDSRKAGLSHVPGPWLAKYTDGWKFFQACIGFGKKELLSARLMEKYGDVVRIGPTSVAVFDHNAVTTVLGAGTRYNKVI